MTDQQLVKQKAGSIDEIAGRAAVVYGKPQSFEEELLVAQSIADIRALLTPDVMKPVMALMNTDLGFRTDRDPKMSKRDRPPIEPYSVEAVRDVVIEARLRGFHVIGNEFNIIAGRFYGTQNGFRRKVLTHPEVTDLKDRFDIPRRLTEGVIVKCGASWKRNGIADSIEREFAIKIDDYTGADAIRGKAERKLYKAIHDRLTGRVTPEGDVTDNDTAGIDGTAASRGRPPGSGKAENETNPAKGETNRSKTETNPSKTPTNAPQTVPEGLLNEAARIEQSGKPITPQDELALVITGAGFNFDQFVALGRASGWEAKWDDLQSFADLPDGLTKDCLLGKRVILKNLQNVAKKGVAA